jgi:hypothetical protein
MEQDSADSKATIHVNAKGENDDITNLHLAEKL